MKGTITMKNCKSKMTYDIVYEYFKDIEYTYEVLKEIDGKTINELSVEQYDYLNACELRECEIDSANQSCTEKYNFLKEAGYFACKCLECLGICTLFLPYDAISIERIGQADDMDGAKLKCNLLNINNYVEEIKGILLSLGFIL